MAGTDPFPSALVPPDIAQMEEDDPIAKEGYQDPTLLKDMAMEPPSADLAAQTPVAPPPGQHSTRLGFTASPELPKLTKPHSRYSHVTVNYLVTYSHIQFAESGPTVAELLLRMEIDAADRLEKRATQAALGALV